MGWPAGIEHATAALVALAILRDNHLVGRLLGSLSGVAAAVVV
jgi:hypothetical protein